MSISDTIGAQKQAAQVRAVDITQLRLQLRRNGFQPIPLIGKEPKYVNRRGERKNIAWSKLVDADEQTIRAWERGYPGATNTGIIAKRTPFFDIDIMDPAAAVAVYELVRESALERGGEVLARFGKWPKLAVPFRCDAPFKKIATSLVARNGEKHKIEVLTDGQYCVAHGTHPDTNKPYHWQEGRAPWNVPRDELPIMDATYAKTLHDQAVALLKNEFGYTVDADAVASTRDSGVGEHQPVDRRLLEHNIRSGQVAHDSMVRLSASLISQRWPRDAVVSHLQSLWQENKFSGKPHAEWQERWDDIGRTVDSALNKFEPPEEPPPHTEIPEGRDGPDEQHYEEQIGEPKAAPDVRDLAKAYVIPDPATLPKREWLGAGRHYMRGAVSATIGATARGKSTNELAEIVGLACGKNLLTAEPLPTGPIRAGYFSGEEDQAELDRKVAALCAQYNITQSDIGDRLLVRSVKHCIAALKVASLVRGVATLNKDALERLKELTRGLDVASFDPLISFHGVRENANEDMDIVCKEAFGAVASVNNCAVDLVHHVGKPKQGATENTVDDGRGASAILVAVRAARVINVMSAREAGQLGVIEAERRQYARVSNGKANYAPPSDKADWIKIDNVTLANGDNVGVGTLWKPKSAFDGLPSNAIEVATRLAKGADYRADPQSENWFGKALANQFKLPLRKGTEYDKVDVGLIKKIIKTWINNKVLEIKPKNDEHGHEKKFIVPGRNATGALYEDDELSDE